MENTLPVVAGNAELAALAFVTATSASRAKAHGRILFITMSDDLIVGIISGKSSVGWLYSAEESGARHPVGISSTLGRHCSANVLFLRGPK